MMFDSKSVRLIHFPAFRIGESMGVRFQLIENVRMLGNLLHGHKLGSMVEFERQNFVNINPVGQLANYEH